MSIPSTTWWPSRSIPPRSSRTPATGCPGITRPAYPSTIPDEPAPPSILNQSLPAALQPGCLGGTLCPQATPQSHFFRYAALPETHGFDYKLAVLRPKGAKSTKLYCPICDSEYQVRREGCKEEGCPGNVLRDDDGTCLTCGS